MTLAPPAALPRTVERPPAAAPASRPHAFERDRVVLGLVWLASAAWMLAYLRRGWVPHDEGTLAQGAERVLLGELPHRDFVDVYTGALSYLNAASFRLFGETLLSPRIVLFLFALLWVPALYAVARRFARPAAAGGLALLGVAWSIPNYSAAIPSWYNLMFATWGLAALLHGLATGRRRWLAAAGACGGISILFKIPGMFFVAGALVAMAHAEQCETEASAVDGASRPVAYLAFLALCVVGLVAAVGLLVTPAGGRALLNLAAPVAVLGGYLLWSERGLPARPSADRFRSLFRMALPFLAGVAVPLLLFALPFALAGALPDLLNGVFVLPRLRTAFASMPFPPVARMFAAAAVPALALALPARMRPTKVILIALAALLVGLLVYAGTKPWVYGRVFFSVRAALPAAALVGAVALARARRTASPERRAAVFAALSVAALCALVQFPFAAPVYFLYVAPLAVLAVAAVASLGPRGAGPLPAMLLAFYLAFAALWVNRGFIFAMGIIYHPSGETEPLPLARAGGIRVMPEKAADYRVMVDELRRRARGRYVYAGPDAPEVYFLAGFRNPTRQIFEFFDDPAGHDRRLLDALERNGVEAIAINRHPDFSRFPDAAMLAELQARYPHAASYGSFMVAWREPGDARPAPAR